MTTPTKQEQLAEANARALANGTDADEQVSDINDSTGEEGGEEGQFQPERRGADEDRQERREIRMSPADQARLDMAKRFRRQGAEDDVPFNGDLNDPEMLYGTSGREQLEPDAELPDILQPAPAPQVKRTIKVRGQDIELSEDEILERARKVTAADSYLEEARQLLDEAKTIKAERVSQNSRPPESRTNTQDDGLDTDPSEQRHPPGDELEEAIEQIQYGDPKEAAQRLRNVMKKVSETEANEGQLRRLVNNDIARAQKTLKAFSDANPDIANDPIAASAVEQFVYAVTREEIEKLDSVDKTKIPTNSAELANWHRFYRVNGQEVSSPEQLLEKARARYQTWKGVPPQPQVKQETKGAPRVVVNVDRTERRANLPNQPTRSAAPRPDVQTNAPQGRSRSAVIMGMRQQRGQTVA